MKKDVVKNRLAEAVKECMKVQPVDRITVATIAEQCGVSRQTFYRNFLDKYDLINWYFDKLVMEAFEQIGTKTTIQDCLVKKLHFIEDERVFFEAAFRSEDYNSLREHDFRLILGFYQKLIREKNPKILTDENEALLEMYCQSSVYMTVKWILSGMKKTPEQMAEILVHAIPYRLELDLKKIHLL